MSNIVRDSDVVDLVADAIAALLAAGTIRAAQKFYRG